MKILIINCSPVSPLLEVVTAMYFQEVMMQMNLAVNMTLAKCFRVWQSP